MADPIADVLVVADDPQRLRAAPFHEVARLEAGDVGLVEQIHDQPVQLVEPLPLPRRQVAQRERQQVQRTRSLRLLEVDRDRVHTAFLEPVELARRRPQQARVTDEQCELLLGRGAEVEPLRDAAGQRDRRCILPDGVEDQRGEQQPFRMLHLSVLGRGDGIARNELTDPVDKGEAQHLGGVEQERVAATPVDRLGELGQRALEHTRRLEEAPGADVATVEHREQLLGGVVVPPQRRVTPLADPVQQASAGPRAARDRERGVEREVEHEP